MRQRKKQPTKKSTQKSTNKSTKRSPGQSALANALWRIPRMTRTGEHFNGLSPAENEALAILSEECGEVAQAIGKIQRHGLASRNPFDPESLSNREQLTIELGDVLAALELLVKTGILQSTSALEPLKQLKLSKLPRFLHHISLS